MLRQTIAVVLIGSLAAGGCASGGAPRVESSPTFGPDERAVLVDYVKKLPAGSRVRVERTAGDMLKGTLLKATDDAIVIQRNTRIPEAPVNVPLDQITRVTIENGGGSGRSVAIGVAVGVGAFFGIGLILAAIYGGG